MVITMTKKKTAASVAHEIATILELNWRKQVHIEATINAMLEKGFNIKEAESLIFELLDEIVE